MRQQRRGGHRPGGAGLTLFHARSLQAEWCEKLLSGHKTIECRQYPCPAELCGQPVLLVATGGQDGVASLLDETPAGHPGAQVVGWTIFSGNVTYTSPEQFSADYARHCVPPDSVYALKEGATAYGWRVAASGRIHPPRPVPQLHRLLRSVHSVVGTLG